MELVKGRKMMKNEQKWLIFSNFSLKIMALLFMTLDHIGFQISYYFLNESSPVVLILRGLGRLAIPLFAFLIYEGVTHTKSFKKYALRLGIMALFISGVLAFLMYVPNPYMSGGLIESGNIFIDLLLGALGVYLLKNKNVKIKLLSLLPAIYSIVSFAVTTYQINNGVIIDWFPFYLRTQYGWLAVLMIMGFYLAKILKDLYLRYTAKNMGVDVEVLILSPYDVWATNLFNMMTVVFFAIGAYVLTWFFETPFLPYQWLSLFSGALLLCYNGKRGYNKKWFEYGAYIYYPLHLAVLAVIFYLLTL
jgi:hypothetical protein